MADFYLTEQGDIRIDGSGDIATTEDEPWRSDAQQVYVRSMTEPGDWLSFPTLGADLNILYGMPQSPSTAERGKAILQEALDREGIFVGKRINIQAVPTGPQSIRFDIYMISGTRSDRLLAIEQKLGVLE